MYVVELSQNASSFLENLDGHIRERIEKRLKNLKQNPYPSDAKFIARDASGKLYRYRIGAYRALYSVEDELGIILITKIDKRPRVYDK